MNPPAWASSHLLRHVEDLSHPTQPPLFLDRILPHEDREIAAGIDAPRHAGAVGALDERRLFETPGADGDRDLKVSRFLQSTRWSSSVSRDPAGGARRMISVRLSAETGGSGLPNISTAIRQVRAEGTCPSLEIPLSRVNTFRLPCLHMLPCWVQGVQGTGAAGLNLRRLLA